MTVSSPPLSERVAAILEAACRVVVREGAHGLRMAGVAEEAGVSKALVHYYFSTRQELLRHVFAYSEARLDDAVDRELSRLPSGAARLERALVISVEAGTPFREMRALWNEVWSSFRFDGALRPLAEQSYGRWLDRIVELVEEGRADGSLTASVDPAEAGRRLIAVAEGIDSLLYLGLVGREEAHELLLGGLRRETPPA